MTEEEEAWAVQARLETNERVVWFSNEGEAEGAFEFRADSGGLHRFCVENGKHLEADGVERQIGWALRVRSLPRSLEEDIQGPDQQRALQLVEWASELQESWETLRDHYGFLKRREFLHKQLTEQTLSRVIRWTSVEGLVLALIAVGQVLYLRKFMETRSYL